MTKRRRFKSEADIMTAIDVQTSRALAERREAEALDARADAIFHSGTTEALPIAEAKHARARAAVLRRGQERRERRMRRLKETLAVFRTQPLAFLEDESEPLARL